MSTCNYLYVYTHMHTSIRVYLYVCIFFLSIRLSIYPSIYAHVHTYFTYKHHVHTHVCAVHTNRGPAYAHVAAISLRRGIQSHVCTRHSPKPLLWTSETAPDDLHLFLLSHSNGCHHASNSWGVMASCKLAVALHYEEEEDMQAEPNKSQPT